LVIKAISLHSEQQARVSPPLRAVKMAAVLWLVAAVTSVPAVRGCHWTTVTISNGTWCCGKGGEVSLLI
jgi:hypothetical protein